MNLFRVILLIGLVAVAGGARAASIPLLSGPQDPSQLNATVNGVINQINGILNPLLPTVTGSVNAIALVPALTGQPAQLGLQAGADANAGIQINPNGSGNISLFGQTNTGLLQFGNQVSWYPANGLTACPGLAPRTAGGLGLAPGPTVTGYIGIYDWLSRVHWMVACG